MTPGVNPGVPDPDIPLDNNSAEHHFRPVANFRKNCFGVHSEKFGHITAMMLSIIATLKLNGIVPRVFLQEYFQAIAAHDRVFESIAKDFLPWNLPAESQVRLTAK